MNFVIAIRMVSIDKQMQKLPTKKVKINTVQTREVRTRRLTRETSEELSNRKIKVTTIY